MFLEEVVVLLLLLLLKKEPRKGIGIDERTMAGLKFALRARWNGNARDVLLFKAYNVLRRVGKEGNRMGIYFPMETLKSGGSRIGIRKLEVI